MKALISEYKDNFEMLRDSVNKKDLKESNRIYLLIRKYKLSDEKDVEEIKVKIDKLDEELRAMGLELISALGNNDFDKCKQIIERMEQYDDSSEEYKEALQKYTEFEKKDPQKKAEEKGSINKNEEELRHLTVKKEIKELTVEEENFNDALGTMSEKLKRNQIDYARKIYNDEIEPDKKKFPKCKQKIENLDKELKGSRI